MSKKKKPKKYDRLKMLKKMSREEEQLYGRSGPHKNKNEKRKRKKKTHEYLEEIEDE